MIAEVNTESDRVLFSDSVPFGCSPDTNWFVNSCAPRMKHITYTDGMFDGRPIRAMQTASDLFTVPSAWECVG